MKEILLQMVAILGSALLMVGTIFSALNLWLAVKTLLPKTSDKIMFISLSVFFAVAILALRALVYQP